MTRARRLAGLLAACLLTAARAQAQAWGAGDIFEAGVGGRALAMGGAQVAESGDAAALCYNPAGLALLEASQVELMHAALFDGASFDHFAYAHSSAAKPAAWGVQVLRLNSGAVPGADAHNNPTGSYQYGETAAAGGFGERGAFLPLLSLGGQAKLLKRSLPGSSDRFIGADFGAQYGPILDDRLTLGAAARNVFALAGGDTADRLPLHARAGASWRPFRRLDFTSEVDEGLGVRFGVEYSFGAAALRAGYAPDGISFGGGVAFRRSFSFDLAMLEVSGLGLSQRVSLSYRFQPRKKPRRLNALAGVYLQNGVAELQARDYVAANRDIAMAIGLEPGVGDGQWKRRAGRLDEMIRAAGLEESPQDQGELRSPGPAGELASRAVSALLDGEPGDAMILAQVAAGSGGRDSAFGRLLKGMAQVARQNIAQDDVVASAAFVADRARRTIEAARARRYDAALRAAKEALLIAPEDPEAWIRRGSVDFAAGRGSEALKSYRKALDLKPDDERLRAFVKEKFGE